MNNSNNNVNSIREVVRAKLEQLSRNTGQFRETYLFRDDKFQGVKFEQALFSAVWYMGQNEVPVMREKQQVLLIDLNANSSLKRAA